MQAEICVDVEECGEVLRFRIWDIIFIHTLQLSYECYATRCQEGHRI